MTSSPGLAWTRLVRAWREAGTDAETHVAGYRAWRERLARLGVTEVGGLEVLEVGCGERAQLSLLFAADGARVIAADIRPIALGWRRPSMWLAVARSEGPLAALRAVARDAVHTVRYWRHLAGLVGRLPFSAVTVVQADATRLPFADETFDLVVSSAVWEHLADVESATREVARVLRVGGHAAIQIALFPALQGGHHAEWHTVESPGPRTIRPWDHLRPGRAPLPTPLNEWRESQYRDVLERCLDVTEWNDGELRGATLLDASFRADLAGYSERDLLLSSITAWARKPTSQAEPASGTSIRSPGA